MRAVTEGMAQTVIMMKNLLKVVANEVVRPR